jgi:hypothetical protein
MVDEKTVNCEHVWRKISDYLEGEVDAALRASMEQHFSTCKRCASVLAGTRNVIQLYGDERMMEVPAGYSQRLENWLDQQLKEPRLKSASGKMPAWMPSAREPRWSSWSAWLMPVAAMALFVGALAIVDQLTFHEPPKSKLAEPGHNIPPDMLVVVSGGSKLFHVAGCSFIHDKATERTITAKEAIQDGYTPCPRCMRKYLTTGVIGALDEDEANPGGAEEASTTRR